MQIFINECSLSSQYKEEQTFIEAFKLFLSALKRISEIKHTNALFKSNSLYYYNGLENSHLGSFLRRNHALNAVFSELLNKLAPTCWEKEKEHENDGSYICFGKEHCGTSVAELTERKIKDQNLCGFLLNFKDSYFGNELEITVLKNNETKIGIDCIIEPESIEEWLIGKGIINPDEDYDESSSYPPFDIQTLVKDTTQFKVTNRPRNQGRLIYSRIGFNQLWVMDNFHSGPKAHFEVFCESTGKYLGTSKYNEINIIPPKKKDRNRSL